MPVDGKRGAGKRTRPERGFVEPLSCISHPAAVPVEHLGVGQQVMAEGHRLCGLQVRKARHDGFCVLIGPVEDTAL